MLTKAWTVHSPPEPMLLEQRQEVAGAGEVLVAVAGCGVCHTDLGFFFEGVPTRHPWPLTLGHEIAGRVIECGPGAEEWLGQEVVVPAVIPCGQCPACSAGRGQICPRQVFPGNDIHGGFASHVRVPARGLCPVPDLGDPVVNPLGLSLPTLAVVADAVSTPFQAIRRSGLRRGDLAVVIGCGGVGGFAVQIAAALGASVAAVDVDRQRLDSMRTHGAAITLDARQLDFKAIKSAVSIYAGECGIPSFRHFIFEASGTTAGQATAWGLLGPGGYLSVLGYTAQKLELRLSNLMAFDATAQGNWACQPALYPEIVGMVLAGSIAVQPFLEFRPLDEINDVFTELHHTPATRRVVLTPENQP